MESETGRLEAFSDGIFSVAITLLALEIGVAEYEGVTNASLLDHIIDLWPKYLAYVNSFATVLLMWLAHHAMFKLIRKTSNSLILANGFLLMIIALVPFPTKTVGEFIDTGAREMTVKFYTGYFVLVSLSFLLLWRTATAHRYALLQPKATDGMISRPGKIQQTGLAINLVCFGLSFVSPWLGIAATTMSWIYWAVIFKD